MSLFVVKQWLETPLTTIQLVLLSVLLILLVSVYILGQSQTMFRRKPNLLPSPRKLPIIGNLHQLGSMPHRNLMALAKDYGPMMLLHLGSTPTIVVSSPDMAMEVMKTQDVVFATRPKLETSKRLLYDCKDIAFAPYGEYWRQVRKVCVLHLLSAKVVHSFQGVRDEEIALMVDKISSFSSSGPVNLSEMLTTFTNDIVCRAAVGKKYSGDETTKNSFHEMIKELVELLGTYKVGDHIPSLAWIDKLSGLETRVKNISRRWDSFLEGVIEEQVLLAKNINSQENKNFISLLLGLQKDATIDGISLSRDSIKAILMDMFTAGTDTSSSLMAWAMAELLRHPEVMKKAQEEVRSIVRQNSTVCMEDLEQMNYIKLVIKEALRLHSPVPLLPREAMKEAKIGIYDIPCKTRLVINAWAIARDPELWEEPEKFWPERFIENPLDFTGHDFQFLPFGAGRRKCPGIQFAMPIVELALANLLHHFDWELPNEIAAKDLDMTEKFGLTLCLKSDLVVVAKPHSA